MMAVLPIRTIEGGETELADAELRRLQSDLRGRLIVKDDPGYGEARKRWNGMIDRRPALITQCAGPTDVVASVRFAREHSLLVAVRGGGHNVAGSSLCDGGLVIDLSAMRGVRVDAGRRRAWAAGGATLGDLDRETAPYGLAAPIGLVSHRRRRAYAQWWIWVVDP